MRVSILRFENLTGDAAADWIGRAIPEVMRAELASDRDLYAISAQRLRSVNSAFGPRNPAAPGISTERTPALGLQSDRIAYGDYSVSGGKLHARLTVEDTATGKMVQVIDASAARNDVAAVADALAHRLSSQAGRSPFPGTDALQLYTQALETTNAAEAAQLLQRVISAGPDFGPAYRYLAEVKARSGDPAGAAQLLEAALARGPVIGEAEQARTRIALAAIKNDTALRRRAAAALTTVEPQDPTHWQVLAEAAMAQQDYSAAAQAYRKITESEPTDANAWNLLGYAAGYAGDMPASMEALRRYQTLRPGDPNPSDSMGDVNFIQGNFAEAEKLYLENARKNPTFLNGIDFFKGAMARLMTGDVPGASGLANEYADARAKVQDPSVGYYRAQWNWLSGRRKQACAEMEDFARRLENGPGKEFASRAYSELAIWNLLLGARDQARQYAAKALSQAGPSTSGMAGIAALLSQPAASSAEWTAHVDRAFPNAPPGSLKDVVLGYALLVEKDFPAATEVLKGFAATPGGSADPGPPLALAWAQIESGKGSEAAPALRFNPIPQATGPGPFVGFYFPRIFYLRGQVAKQQGKTAEARANFDLFLKLSGPDPLLWGEEQRVK